jgi:hypothetical protein
MSTEAVLPVAAFAVTEPAKRRTSLLLEETLSSVGMAIQSLECILPHTNPATVLVPDEAMTTGISSSRKQSAVKARGILEEIPLTKEEETESVEESVEDDSANPFEPCKALVRTPPKSDTSSLTEDDESDNSLRPAASALSYASDSSSGPSTMGNNDEESAVTSSKSTNENTVPKGLLLFIYWPLVSPYLFPLLSSYLLTSSVSFFLLNSFRYHSQHQNAVDRTHVLIAFIHITLSSGSSSSFTITERVAGYRAATKRVVRLRD